MRLDDIIRVPYTTSPRMEKYEGDLLSCHDGDSLTELQRYRLNEKRKELKFQGENIWFQSDLAYHHKLVGKACEVLGIERETEITKLGLKIQEDIAIMHRGRLEAAFVAFPSGWKPGDKQGQSLTDLHAPVADGKNLRQMSSKLTELMCSKYRFHRSVWTLTTSRYLSAYPDYVHPDPTALDKLWLRIEHQKTFPIQEGTTSGFLIYVYLIPYWFLFDPIKEKIKQSINTMSESVLIYKNLHKIKQLINAHEKLC